MLVLPIPTASQAKTAHPHTCPCLCSTLPHSSTAQCKPYLCVKPCTGADRMVQAFLSGLITFALLQQPYGIFVTDCSCTVQAPLLLVYSIEEDLRANACLLLDIFPSLDSLTSKLIKLSVSLKSYI